MKPGRALLDEVIDVARAAGEEVLDVYARGCAVHSKHDGSPVTEADERAHRLICSELERVAPGVPVVSEEATGPTAGQAAPSSFWLVDPLDGTKEFIARNGEFTINVALIEDGIAVLGVVYAPVSGAVFAGSPDTGALVEDGAGRRAISARRGSTERTTVVVSRRHGDQEGLERVVDGRPVGTLIRVGSSLKFCLLAAGRADLYPRLGTTMEWDTAAGDAVLRAAGGSVTDLEGRPLRYGKPGFENPHFIARGLDDVGVRRGG